MKPKTVARIIITIIILVICITIISLAIMIPKRTTTIITVTVDDAVINAAIKYHGIKYYQLRYAPGDNISKGRFYFVRDGNWCLLLTDNFITSHIGEKNEREKI